MSMTAASTGRTLLAVRLHWGVFVAPAAYLALVGPLVLISSYPFFRLGSSFGANPPYWLLAFLAGIAELPGLVLLAAAFVAYLKSRVLLTEERIVFETGWLLRTRGDLPLASVETTFLLEPLLGRMFGYGTVVVVGKGGTQFPLSFVARPQVLYGTLQSALGQMRVDSLPKKAPPPPPNDDSRYMPKA